MTVHLHDVVQARTGAATSTVLGRVTDALGLVPLYFLIGFRNRLAVALDWFWSY